MKNHPEETNYLIIKFCIIHVFFVINADNKVLNFKVIFCPPGYSVGRIQGRESVLVKKLLTSKNLALTTVAYTKFRPN